MRRKKEGFNSLRKMFLRLAVLEDRKEYHADEVTNITLVTLTEVYLRQLANAKAAPSISPGSLNALALVGNVLQRQCDARSPRDTAEILEKAIQRVPPLSEFPPTGERAEHYENGEEEEEDEPLSQPEAGNSKMDSALSGNEPQEGRNGSAPAHQPVQAEQPRADTKMGPQSSRSSEPNSIGMIRAGKLSEMTEPDRKAVLSTLTDEEKNDVLFMHEHGWPAYWDGKRVTKLTKQSQQVS
jgi:hypothetical protein